MSKKKSKVLKGFLIAGCVLLATILIVVVALLFPLKGEKHIEVWGAKQEFTLDKIQTVEKTRDDFKILVMADTQLWSDQRENKKCYAEMDKLVEKTNPDMIVTLGDNLSAFENRFSIGKFVKKMDSYGIPWTPVFGNHDGEVPGTSLNWIADQMMKGENCLFEKGPSNLYGCGNYVVNINEKDKPVYSLYLLDNGRYIDYGEEKGNHEIYMGYEQIAWYEWNVKGMEKAVGETVPSMTFSHFAQPEFRDSIEKYAEKQEDGSYIIPEEYGFGKCQYLPSAPLVNSGFVDKCKELGSTHYMFCGHDHENNGVMTVDGMTYAYGLKTGPSPIPWNYATEMGGTLVTLDKENNVNIEYVVLTKK